MNEKPIRPSNRGYVVLEDRELGEVVRSFLDESNLLSGTDRTALLAAFAGVHVYHEISRPDARNAEHALKQAGQVVDAGTPVLIPVPLRYFQPQTVDASDERQVKVGGR